MTEKQKRGGKREGAGMKPKGPNGSKVRISVRIDPLLSARLDKEPSKADTVGTALTEYFEKVDNKKSI